jgi:16S rRNA (cytosine1402-N4)-methyltransferase
MTAGGDGFTAVAGGPAPHIPVLGAPALQSLNVRDGGIYIDGTFGAGGHTRAILAAARCNVLAIDRDPSAIARGAEMAREFGGRLTVVEDRFSNLEAIVRARGIDAVDGILLDVGVSSMQLDTAERGFSFRLEGPLDMRMGGSGPSAADVVAHADERSLANIIFLLGEERQSRAIARAIVKSRETTSLSSTRALADLVASVVRMPRGGIHPATRTFQALRIFVNDELGELLKALVAAERILKAGGRLAVISFHSLEDRLVKSFFASRGETPSGSRHQPERTRKSASFKVLTKRPIVPDEDEIETNPRARSAKLRVAERTDAPARDADDAKPLPRLPSLADVMKGR